MMSISKTSLAAAVLAFVAVISTDAAAAVAEMAKPKLDVVNCANPDEPHKSEILEFEFDGCTDYPCTVYSGTTATGFVLFESYVDTERLGCRLEGVMGNVTVPFRCDNADACLDLEDGDCPVEDGEELGYKLAMWIDPTYPKVPVTGRWILTDDKDETVLCIEVDVKIEPAP